MATDVGIMTAADSPCTTRAVNNHAMLGASPDAMVDNAKATAPTRNDRLSPNPSPSMPPSTRNAANGRMFAVSTHWPMARGPFQVIHDLGDGHRHCRLVDQDHAAGRRHRRQRQP
jgi:hypothetical protein